MTTKMTRETHPKEFEAGDRMAKYCKDNSLNPVDVMNSERLCQQAADAMNITDMQVVECCLVVIHLI